MSDLLSALKIRRETVRLPRWLSLTIRLLGALFLITGLAKLPVLGAFNRTIGEILQTGPHLALGAALAVCSVEIVCGSMLLLLRRVRLAAGGLLLLTLGFLLVLFPAAAGGPQILCNCFGTLGIHLSNRAEFLLDLGLLDLLLIVLFFVPRRRLPQPRPGWAKPLSVTALACLVAAQVFLAVETQAAADRAATPLLSALTFAAEQKPETTGRTMLMLLNFPDFTCPLCFQDFLELVDSLRAADTGRTDGRIIALMRRGGSERLQEGNRLAQWGAETGIGFPVRFAPDSLFAAHGITKSLVAVIEDSRRLLFQEQIPMGEGHRRLALRLLLEEPEPASER